MKSHFFAILSRMKYIHRWALMRNSYQENISEHSLDVAIIAHALCNIGNVRLGKNLDGEHAAALALFHDSPEIITGDMPTPIKYYNNDTQDAFKKVEDEACTRLLELLPEDLRASYKPLFIKEEKDAYLWKIVKAADRMSALIKCIEEEKTGNAEFSGAKKGIYERLIEMELPEVSIYLEEFLPSYYLTLDELRKDNDT